MKTFYIVNDYKDLLSGNVIPHKVLEYLPVTQPLYPIQTTLQPVPITKSQGLTLNLNSPELYPLSPLSPIIPTTTFVNPNVSVSRTVIAQNPIISNFDASTVYGPPIIKSSILTSNSNAIILIQSGTDAFSLNIPMMYLRDVTNCIWANAQIGLNPLHPKTTFRIKTPVLDTGIATTYDRMIEMIRKINQTYSGVTYTGFDVIDGKLERLIALLLKR